MKRKLAVAGIALLAACTLQEQQQAMQFQSDIGAACNVAMTLAPIAGPIAPWIIGGCGTEQAIAKLALDPSSLQWLNGLIAKVRGA